ncbi:MAG: DUF1565 domain-containing protein [Proteobacteria bacterium]|nr:DUF1565 domain-containing protein [Pseudomonadota bacterium]
MGIDAIPSVIFVNDTAIGGLGNTRIGAFKTIGKALAKATAGTTVAVAKGTYDEVLTIPDGVTVLGACAAETIIHPTGTGDRTSESDGVVRAGTASTGTLRNISVVASAITLVGIAAYGDRKLVIGGVAVSSAYRVGLYAQGAATLTATEVTVADTRPGSDGLDGSALFVDAGIVTIKRAMLLGSHEVGVAVLGGSATLEDVAVIGTQTRQSDGALGVGLLVESGGQATISRSLLDSNSSAGIVARDAGVLVSLTDTVVRRTKLGEATSGFGLLVGPGAATVATRSTFDRNQTAGIIAGGAGAQLSLTDVVVTHTSTLASGDYGRGLDLESGAVSTIVRAVFDANHDNGVFISDPGTSLDATDLTILRTAPGAASVDGIGALQIRNGGFAIVSRSTIASNQEGGVQAVDAGTSVSISDLVMVDTDCGPSLLGSGVDIGDGAHVTLASATLTRSQHVGVFSSGSGTELMATDVTVASTRPADTGERGWGLRVQDGASVQAERAVLDANQELGVFARDPGTSAVLIDVAITGTTPAAAGTGGYGIVTFNGASLSAARGTIAQNHAVGVIASDATVTLTDVRVTETQPSPDGTHGWGVAAQDGAALGMTRVAVVGSTDLGVFAFGADVTLQDVLVSGVLDRPCLTSASCPAGVTWESGMGAAILNSSHLSATSLEVESASRCGILASASPIGGNGASGMTLAFTTSATYRSAIGFCQQVTGLAPSAGLYLDQSTNPITSQISSFAPATRLSFL